MDAQFGVIVAYKLSKFKFFDTCQFHTISSQSASKMMTSLKSGFHTRVDNRMNVEIGKNPQVFWALE